MSAAQRAKLQALKSSAMRLLREVETFQLENTTLDDDRMAVALKNLRTALSSSKGRVVVYRYDMIRRRNMRGTDGRDIEDPEKTVEMLESRIKMMRTLVEHAIEALEGRGE